LGGFPAAFGYGPFLQQWSVTIFILFEFVSTCQFNTKLAYLVHYIESQILAKPGIEYQIGEPKNYIAGKESILS
jgi:hypothetical protein